MQPSKPPQPTTSIATAQTAVSKPATPSPSATPPLLADTLRITQRRQPVVTYHRRMLPRKAYPLVVRLDQQEDELGPRLRGESSSSSPTVLVRPVLPGALVTPATIEVSAQSGNEARFWVMPLSRGRWKDARVEFRSAGRNLGNVATPIKVGRRRLMWFFAFLTIAVPCFLYYQRSNPWEPPRVAVVVARRENAGNPPAEAKGVGKAKAPQPKAPGREPPPPQIKSKSAFEATDHFADEARRKPSSSWDTPDVVAVGLSYVKPLLVGAYSVLEFLRNLPFAELYVAVPLLAFTLLAWFFQAAGQVRRRGAAFELEPT